MKILVDMNLSPLWVPFLASHQLEATHWSTVGKPWAPDVEILSFALAKSYVILTHDLDFGMLLAAHGAHGPSVIQVRAQNVLPSAMGTVVVRAIRAARPQLENGALVTIDPHRERIRILPI
jgi:predicted nuclease of predicted toxin-antitoxin system